MARNFRAIIARDGGSVDDGDVFTTEDGRAFPAGAFVWRTPPLSMMAQTVTPDFGGHAGAFLLGQMASIERDGDLIIATGTLNDEGDGEDAERRRDTIAAIERGDLNGVSVDPAGVEYRFVCVRFDEEQGWCEEEILVFDSYTIGAATVVNVPAIDGTLIELDPADAADDGEGTGGEETEADAVAASAAATLEHPPAAWFELAEPDEPTPFTVTDDGQVFGHVAPAGVCHIGYPDACVTVWNSPTNYAYFHVSGPVRAQGADGLVDVPVGAIAASGGHFPTQGDQARDWRSAQAHYDDPTTCAAYVRAVDGEHGVWVSGALRHGATAEQIALLRNHPPSGDWRRIGGQMEMVGVCSVVVPGFPLVRQIAMAASASGDLEPVAAIVNLGHRGRCDECGGEHETPARTAAGSPRSLRAEAIDQRLAAVESTLATIADALGPQVREEFRSRMRA